MLKFKYCLYERSGMTHLAVIGSGTIGEKARQLSAKGPILQDIGFRLPPRIVLAEGFFDGFFQRHGLGRNLRDVTPSDDLESRVRTGSVTAKQFSTLQHIAAVTGNKPVVVRSSAEGDSRGTGTYASEFAMGDAMSISRALGKVLASYFSKDAVAFRKDAQLQDGFAVMIEPLVAHELGWIMTPLLSGSAYTSTSRGPCTINVVPGLGGGGQTRDAEQITRKGLRACEGFLGRYIYEEVCSFGRSQPTRRSALLGTNESYRTPGEYTVQAFCPRTKYDRGGLHRTTMRLEDEMDRKFGEVNLLTLFDMLEAAEQRLGKPQYAEWAMTLDHGVPAYWLLQIADVDKKHDVLDFGDLGTVLMQGHTVTGTGVHETDTMFTCWNPDDICALNEFNRTHTGYVLIYSSRLVTSALGYRRMTYSDFNNAQVFLELQDAAHADNPVSHLGEQLDTAKKLFGVVDYREECAPNWKAMEKRQTRFNDAKVYEGKVRIISSERQNRIVVSALE